MSGFIMVGMLLLLLNEHFWVLLWLLPNVWAQLAPLVFQTDWARLVLLFLLQLLLLICLAMLFSNCESSVLGRPASPPGLVVASVRGASHGHVGEGVRQVGQVHGAAEVMRDVRRERVGCSCWPRLSHPRQRRRRRTCPSAAAVSPRWRLRLSSGSSRFESDGVVGSGQRVCSLDPCSWREVVVVVLYGVDALREVVVALLLPGRWASRLHSLYAMAYDVVLSVLRGVALSEPRALRCRFALQVKPVVMLLSLTCPCAAPD